MRFTKVESVGNDYVLADAVRDPDLAHLDGVRERAIAMSDRRFGVGADGLLVLTRGSEGVLALAVHNADGSPGGVCGNGLRCAVRLAVERGYASDSEALAVRMGGREFRARVVREQGLFRGVDVDMGPPVFEEALIPFDRAHAESISDNRFWIMDHEVRVCSMGNPHAVLFDDAAEGALDSVGPAIERHPAFPERTNVHAVTVRTRSEIRVASWERGSGRTLGCGTGVCAAVALGVRDGLLDGVVRVEVPGGVLRCSWSGETGDGVRLEGPARSVFEGEWGG